MLLSKQQNPDGSVTFTYQCNSEADERNLVQSIFSAPNIMPISVTKTGIFEYSTQPPRISKVKDFRNMIELGRRNEVRSYLLKGMNPNLCENKYNALWSALKWFSKYSKGRPDFRNKNSIKECYEMIELFLQKGANINLIENFENNQNYGFCYIVRERFPLHVLKLFLQYKDKNVDINFKPRNPHFNFWDTLLGACLKKPNYKKFQLLLCHGLTLNQNIIDQCLPGMMYTNNPRSPPYWRKNQHKRKTVAALKMWPTAMMLYCIEKIGLHPLLFV